MAANTLAVGDNALLLIELDIVCGLQCGMLHRQRFEIFGGNSTVKGLVINRFNGGGIVLSGGGNNIIETFISTVRPAPRPSALIVAYRLARTITPLAGQLPPCATFCQGNTFGVQICCAVG